VPRLIRVTGLLVVRADIEAARATPVGSRAGPGRGRTEALEQWNESGTEYQLCELWPLALRGGPLPICGRWLLT
jgi:hypothetical protein